MEMHTVLAALDKAQEALDVLAEEAGHPARAEQATELAQDIRGLLLQAGWRVRITAQDFVREGAKP